MSGVRLNVISFSRMLLSNMTALRQFINKARNDESSTSVYMIDQFIDNMDVQHLNSMQKTYYYADKSKEHA